MSRRTSSRIPGFYKLDLESRRRRVAAHGNLRPDELTPLDTGGICVERADGMIENVIGRFALPMGVALNFLVDDTDYLVPMVIEEPSVVAAASNAARMVRAGGGFRTDATAPVMIGQVQLTDIASPDAAAGAVLERKQELLADAAALVPRLVARGGGPKDIEVRVLSRPGQPDGGVIVVHLLIDCCDAMGANLVNTVAEGLAPALAEIAGGRVGLRILSNLCDQRRVRVTCRVPDAALVCNQQVDGAAVRESIVAASRFAELDPYRAATHNKGLMNGLDAVLLATANDWRGVEAGAHAYAARSGQYKPLAVWRSDGNELVGDLDLPIAVGTVGGALQVHDGARLALALLAADSATALASVAASAGLASNLAALRALATVGIQQGHMSLHARIVAQAAGATGNLIEVVASELSALGDVKPERAREILARLRASRVATGLALEESL